MAINITRDEVAHKVHMEAYEAIRKLEQEANKTFKMLLKARAIMKEIGITADIEMPEYLAVGFRDYKINQEKANV